MKATTLNLWLVIALSSLTTLSFAKQVGFNLLINRVPGAWEADDCTDSEQSVGEQRNQYVALDLQTHRIGRCSRRTAGEQDDESGKNQQAARQAAKRGFPRAHERDQRDLQANKGRGVADGEGNPIRYEDDERKRPGVPEQAGQARKPGHH